MVYGAISTDIKKSSANWNLDPEWMKLAVQYTNTISEFAFTETVDKSIKQLQLPNSPEGDAYTFYFETSESEEYLRRHLYKVASVIQINLSRARESLKRGNTEGEFLCGHSTERMKEKLKKMISDEYSKAQTDLRKIDDLMEKHNFYEKTYPYVGSIYLRIGIAISKSPAIRYYFNGKRSYRGGVIRLSEKAEEQAPWKTGMAEYVDGKVEKRDLVGTDMKLIMTVDEIKKNESLYTYKTVSGYIVFVHYRMFIKESDTKTYPHMLELSQEEFVNLHDHTVYTFDPLGAQLVKIKRDSSSMYFIPKENQMKSQRVNIWDQCCRLLSELPNGSSIGIAYGEGDNLTRATKGKIRDYFGPTVNLSARLSSVDWSYQTVVGKTLPRNHMNRVALGDMDRQNIVEILEPPRRRRSMTTKVASFVPYPYTVDQIPVMELNIGYSGYVYVLSKYVQGSTDVKEGERVKWETKSGVMKGVVEEILLGDAMVRHGTDLERIPLRILQRDVDEERIIEGVERLLGKGKIKYKF